MSDTTPEDADCGCKKIDSTVLTLHGAVLTLQCTTEASPHQTQRQKTATVEAKKDSMVLTGGTLHGIVLK